MFFNATVRYESEALAGALRVVRFYAMRPSVVILYSCHGTPKCRFGGPTALPRVDCVEQAHDGDGTHAVSR